MKHIVSVSFLTFTAMIFTTHTTHLDNKRIKKFDDKKIGAMSVGIDGTLIHDMLWVIDTINSIQRGCRQHNTGRTVKRYELGGTPYTLEQLVHKESEKTFTEEETALFSDILEHIKLDFNDTVTHFMQQLIVKTVVCNAVGEWCTKAGRTSSALKLWVTTNKEEFEAFYQEIDTAQSLDLFLTDLKDFLTDVIDSCPRAWNEFLEHQEYYAKQTTLKKQNA